MTELQHSERRNMWLIIGIILAVLGLGVSVYSTMHHIEVKASGQTDAACNINDTFSCDSVALSQYSELFGIPLGVFGFGYFLACAVLLLIGFMGGKSAREHLHGYTALAIIGVVSSAILGGISLFSLGAFCVTCMVVYALTLLQGALLFVFKKEIPDQFSSNSMFSGGTTAAIAVSAVVAVFSFWSPKASTTEQAADRTDSSMPKYAKQTHDIPLFKTAYAGLGEDYRKGSDNAKVVIHEFGDFECPACRNIAGTLTQIAKEFGNDILVVFRNYPLDQNCNSGIGRKMHEFACKAAVMARCAGSIGKFWPYHDRVYGDQANMKSDSFLKGAASEIGLSQSQIDSCWGNADILNKIKEDITLGNKFGVNSTPTIFINGKKYLGGKSIDALRFEINSLLN